MNAEILDANILIQVIFEAIAEDDVDEIISNINRLPLDIVEDDIFEYLLALFITSAHEYANVKALNAILEGFDQAILDDTQEIQSRVFTLMELEDDVLRWVAKVTPSITYETVISDLMRGDSNQMLQEICRRVTEVFNINDVEIFEEFRIEAHRIGNERMEMFFGGIKELYAPFANIPEWVTKISDKEWPEDRPYEDDLKLPAVPNPPLSIPPIDVAINMLTDGLKSLGFSSHKQDQMKEAIEVTLATSSDSERYQLLLPILTSQVRLSLDTDNDIFRILGPVNAILDSDLEEDHQCCYYGGCRMFTCVCFERYDVDSDTILPNNPRMWFREACDYCHNKIRHWCHAFRNPLDHGGFLGCYCSIECLELDLGEMPILKGIILNKLKTQLTEIGIIDRRYS